MLVPFSFPPPTIESEDLPPEPEYPKPLSVPQVQLCRQQVSQAECKKQKGKRFTPPIQFSIQREQMAMYARLKEKLAWPDLSYICLFSVL